MWQGGRWVLTASTFSIYGSSTTFSSWLDHSQFLFSNFSITLPSWTEVRLNFPAVGIPEPGFDSSSQFTFVMGLKSMLKKSGTLSLFSAQVQKKLWKPNQRADMSCGPQGFCWVYSSSYSLGASPAEVWHFWRIIACYYQWDYIMIQLCLLTNLCCDSFWNGWWVVICFCAP